MKIKMIKDYTGPGFNLKAGYSANVPKNKAEELISSGFAEKNTKKSAHKK